jgi:Reverse transcriptase (RNA-dependent DNA polymerase)
VQFDGTVPTILDRVCQQALVQVLEPIFEPTFREASFGYRPGRSAHMAMRRIWRQLERAEWIVDGDIADFFGSLPHERLVDLVADRVADGKVLSLIRSMLTAGALVDGVFESAIAGTPQGGVATAPTQWVTSVGASVRGGDRVADRDLVVVAADQDFADDEPQDALLLVERELV